MNLIIIQAATDFRDHKRKPMQLDPQMIKVIEKRAALASETDDLAALPIEEIRKAYNTERAFWNEIKPRMHEVLNTTVAGLVTPGGFQRRRAVIFLSYPSLRCA